jgi:hypothetical protein
MRRTVLLKGCLVLGMMVFAVETYALTSDNLLANPGFSSNLSGWERNADFTQWSSKDALGSSSSGSALINFDDSGGGFHVIGQCILVPPSPGPFDVGGKFFFPSGQEQRAFGAVLVVWFSDSACSGSALRTDEFDTPVPLQTESWRSLFGYRLAPPAGAGSALVDFGVSKYDSAAGSGVSCYVDETFFRSTSCTPSDVDLCLHGGRFRVTAEWESPTDGGIGHGVAFNDDSGWFWFFTDTNTEVVVKTVSACADPFNRYWVFAAGLTNVLVTLNVEDTAAGVANYYINPAGTAFVPIQDTQAFDTCP